MHIKEIKWVKLKAQGVVTTMGSWAWKVSSVLWERGWGPSCESRTKSWSLSYIHSRQILPHHRLER